MGFKWRILCYHEITHENAGPFSEQLDYFLEEGWQYCSLSEGIERMKRRKHGKWLTVSFDDGDRTVWDIAFPILDARGIRGCLYVTADYVARGLRYRDPNALESLTWDQLREWRKSGNDVGSHSYTHAPLTLCTNERLDQELLWSKRIIENEIGDEVLDFSYPWGQHDRRTHKSIRENGYYRTAATIDRGDNTRKTDPLKLRRDAVLATWSVKRLRRVLTLGRFRWLYWFQRLVRRPRGGWSSRSSEWTRLSG